MGVERTPWSYASETEGGGETPSSGDNISNHADDDSGGKESYRNQEQGRTKVMSSTPGIIPDNTPHTNKTGKTCPPMQAHQRSSNSTATRTCALPNVDGKISGSSVSRRAYATLETEPHADPATPPHSRGCTGERRDKAGVGGRRRCRGGAGGTAPSLHRLEVTRSPSYLHGSGGLKISSPPVSVPGRRPGPPSTSAAANTARASPSPSRAVSTKRCNKLTPSLHNSISGGSGGSTTGVSHQGVTAVSASANGDPRDNTANTTITCSNGSVLPPTFLPPPPIQGDRCRRWSGSGTDISAASSNGPTGGGGGGGSGRGLLSGVPMTPNAVRDREDNRRVGVSSSGNIRTGSAGSWNGSGYLSGPETPTTAATNAAAGACVTPGICSPPTSCHYGGGAGGGRRGRGGRRSGKTGVSTGQTKRIHRLRGRCGGDRGCERGAVVAAAAPVNGAATAAGTNASLASAAAVGTRGSVKAAGDVSGGGSGSGGGNDGTAPSGSALADRLDPLHGGGGGGGGRDGSGGCGKGPAAGASDGRGGGRRRDKSVDSSSSVEHFTDYSDDDDDGINADIHDQVDGASDAAGSFSGERRKEAGTDGSRRGRGVRLRRRRRQRRDEDTETEADFRGRTAAIASATRICLVATSSSTTGSTVATPPHPIPRVTTPAVPRRRQLNASPPVSINSPSEWCTPSLRGGVGGEDGGGGTPIIAAGEGHRGTPGFDGGGRESGRVRGGRALRPSEKTAPISRLWPDFDDFRYKPPEAEVTPLGRSDWTVERGSTLYKLKEALEATVGVKSGSVPLDLRLEGKNSLRQRYKERCEYFKLIQTARESTATEGSALFRVILQRRAEEEAAKEEAELKAERLQRLKVKTLMRMMEGRRRAFVAWSTYTRRARKSRELLSQRLTSLTQTAFVTWREQTQLQRRAREFALKHLAGSKRSTFMTWKAYAEKAVAVRRMALGRLQDSQKACFGAWRDHTKVTTGRRNQALLRSQAGRSALSGLSGVRGLFMRWKERAQTAGAARRMARRLREAALRRCFLALASNQLKLRTVLETRRLGILENAFSAWKTGLGIILRCRLLPAQGEQDLLPSPQPKSASTVNDANEASLTSIDTGVSAAITAVEAEAETSSVVSIEVVAAPMPGEADWQEVVWREIVEDDAQFDGCSPGGGCENASTTAPSMPSMMPGFAVAGKRRSGGPRTSVSETGGGLAEAAIALPPSVEGVDSGVHHEGMGLLPSNDRGFDGMKGEAGRRVDVDAADEGDDSDPGGRGEGSSRCETAGGDENAVGCDGVGVGVGGEQRLLLPSAFFVSSLAVSQPSAPADKKLRDRRRRDRHDGGQGAP